jgi:hypothetical protein
MKLPMFMGLIALIGVCASPGDEILDTKVPSGTIKQMTLGEVVARMQGWSDASAKGGFRLSTPIDPKLSSVPVDRLVVVDDPRPTYEAVLKSAFKLVGRDVALSESKRGLEVTFFFRG